MFKLIFILICIFFLIFSIYFYKKIFNPIGIFNGIFLFSSICFFIDKNINVYNLDMGILWLSLGILFFNISFLIPQILIFSRAKKNVKYNLKVINLYLNLCIFSGVILICISLYEVLPIAGNIKNIFFNSTWVRYKYLTRSDNFIVAIIGNIANITNMFLLCLFPIALKEKVKYSALKLSVVLILRLILSLITMSKDAFLLYIIMLVGAYVQILPTYKKEINFIIKKVIYFLLLIFLLLFIVALQRDYVGTRYNNYFEAIFGTITEYIVIPFESFILLVSSKLESYTYGGLSFRPVNNILSLFGFIQKVDIKQEVLANAPGNVYTMFGTMYRDFDKIGILIISVIYGIFCGMLYKRKSNLKPSNIFCNALIIMVCFFGFYDFKFIQTVYLVSIFYALMFERVFFKKLYK